MHHQSLSRGLKEVNLSVLVSHLLSQPLQPRAVDVCRAWKMTVVLQTRLYSFISPLSVNRLLFKHVHSSWSDEFAMIASLTDSMSQSPMQQELKSRLANSRLRWRAWARWVRVAPASGCSANLTFQAKHSQWEHQGILPFPCQLFYIYIHQVFLRLDFSHYAVRFCVTVGSRWWCAHLSTL